MLKRVVVFLRTEGLIKTVRSASNAVMTAVGLRKAETYIFKKDLLCASGTNNSPQDKQNVDVNLVIIQSAVMLNEFIMPMKFNNLPYKKWFSNEAVCLALENRGEIIAYTWVHLYQYNLGVIGDIFPMSQEIYIGPFYVLPEYRRKGMYHALMADTLQYAFENQISSVISACNSSNYATIKVMVQAHFNLIGIVRARSGKRTFVELNPDNLLSRLMRV